MGRRREILQQKLKDPEPLDRRWEWGSKQQKLRDPEPFDRRDPLTKTLPYPKHVFSRDVPVELASTPLVAE